MPASSDATDPGANGPRWRGGDDARRSDTRELALDAFAGARGVTWLREKPGRRRIGETRLASGRRCLVKLYEPATGVRGRGLSTLRLSTAARERRNLVRVARAGVPVPECLAHWEAADGRELLLLGFLEGQSLPDALEPATGRRALLRAVGGLVARLHASGHAHRDLHAENLWITEDGPVLLDLQETLPVRSEALASRDRGELDASLFDRLSWMERMTLRMAMLGIDRPFDAEAREALRRLARAGAARRRAHVTSRTARSLRHGRLYAPFALGDAQGMRLRAADEDRLRHGFEGGPPTSDGDAAGPEWRRYDAASPAEALRWKLHGSPARRAWVASHGLRARGIAAPSALAFLESRGATVRTAWLAIDPASPLAEDADADATLRLALRARREGVRHEDWASEPLDVAALCRLERIDFAPRGGGDDPTPLDAWIEARLADAPDALRRYRRANSLQVFP